MLYTNWREEVAKLDSMYVGPLRIGMTEDEAMVAICGQSYEHAGLFVDGKMVTRLGPHSTIYLMGSGAPTHKCAAMPDSMPEIPGNIHTVHCHPLQFPLSSGDILWASHFAAKISAIEPDGAITSIDYSGKRQRSKHLFAFMDDYPEPAKAVISFWDSKFPNRDEESMNKFGPQYRDECVATLISQGYGITEDRRFVR